MAISTGLPKRRTTRAPLFWTLLVLILGVVVVGLWVGSRGASAAAELSTARSFASALRTEMVDGDVQRATKTLEKAGMHTASAVSLTSDPVWRGVEIVPFVGANLAAVRESAQAVDDLVTEVAATILPLAGELDASSFAGTSIPLQPLQEMAPAATQARTAAEGISSRVAGIETNGTLPFVRDAVSDLTDLVTDVTTTMQSIHRATTVLPQMLGANGPRNYLVLFQNNAELRASGGLTGATAVLTASGGNLGLAAQDSSRAYPRLPKPVMPLSPVETQLYGPELGQSVQGVNLTPDFSRTAVLAKAMAEPIMGIPLDGVLTIDPYVLSYVLVATGPLQLEDGSTLSSENVVQRLLSDIYVTIEEPADQDRFFASVAEVVFGALTSEAVDPARLLTAIVRGGDEGRIRVWSADVAEQASLAETTLVAVPSDESDPVLGVYPNDATGAKMSYYLKRVVTISCERISEQQVTVRLNNVAPADAATRLPPYVTGNGESGVPAGSIRTQVLISLPPGAQIESQQGEGMTVTEDDFGRIIVSQFVELEPGEDGEVFVTYSNALPSRVDTTPGLTVNSSERGQARCV